MEFKNFDAVTYQSTDDKYWFFKGDECWSKRYGYHDVISEEKIKDQFPGAGDDENGNYNLSNLDAALYTGSKYWFFKGNDCWSKEHGNHQVSSKKSIKKQFPKGKEKKYDLSNLDAALYSSGTYWFFKKEECWSKEYGDHDVKYRDKIKDNFTNLGSSLDAGTVAQGKYWFFKRHNCWSKKYGNHKISEQMPIKEQFNYSSSNIKPASWMKDSLLTIGDKFLYQVSMPGTHDSGMSKLQNNPPPGVNQNNTQTQSKKFKEQLEAGARYFDIRPVCRYGTFYTGHYSKVPGIGWKGARGESIVELFESINTFTADQNELIILSLSHAYNADNNFKDFTEEDWKRLLELLTGQIKDLFVTTKDLLSEVKINEFIKKKSAVLIIVPDAALGKNATYKPKGVYKASKFSIYDSYSNTSSVDKMTKDQIKKMENNPPTSKRLFLLSWTLTPNIFDVAFSQSIKSMATTANERLYYDVAKEFKNNRYPTIILVDYYADDDKDNVDDALDLALYSNSIQRKLKP